MADKKYLIVYNKLTVAVPKEFQKQLRDSIADSFKDLEVEHDFTGKKQARDLVVIFTREVPPHPVFGESSRPEMNNDLLRGEATVFVGGIRAMRLQMSSEACEKAFPESEASLGSMISNTAIHETGHMLGLDKGGHDGGGHTDDPDNVMWDPLTLPGGSTRVDQFFTHTVKKGDTLSGLVQRFIRGSLDPCRLGATTLTYHEVWDFPPNKEPGFVRDPKKGGVAKRKTDNPNWIYPGEKVAFPNSTLRTQSYRRNYPGFLGKKTFTLQQIETMKKFIAERMKAGRG